jgi:hypothetical protein
MFCTGHIHSLARSAFASLAIIFVLAAAAPAHAALYWAIEVPSPGTPTLGLGAVGRANLDGTAAARLGFPDDSACGVAVDRHYIYWGGREGIGRASIDGADVDACPAANNFRVAD